MIYKEFPGEVIKCSVLWGKDDPEHGIEFVEASSWQSDGKWEYREYIFKHAGKYYSIVDGRTGSYYTDYYYQSREDWGDTVECVEVEKKEIVTHKWVPVKEAKI